MKAMLSHTPGGPETLILTEISLKEPKEGEICIAVKAAGVNFPDTLIIRDLYQIKPPRPFAPGGEVAGIIESIGKPPEVLKTYENFMHTQDKLPYFKQLPF